MNERQNYKRYCRILLCGYGESGIYECRAKGVFRKDGKKPLVGDCVEIEILSGEEKTGNLTEIFARKNELIRPAVANVDQALVILLWRIRNRTSPFSTVFS